MKLGLIYFTQDEYSTDDHRLLLNGTISLVSDRFRDAQIFSVQTAQEARREVTEDSPDLAISPKGMRRAIADLSIPQESEQPK